MDSIRVLNFPAVAMSFFPLNTSFLIVQKLASRWKDILTIGTDELKLFPSSYIQKMFPYMSLFFSLHQAPLAKSVSKEFYSASSLFFSYNGNHNVSHTIDTLFLLPSSPQTKSSARHHRPKCTSPPRSRSGTASTPTIPTSITPSSRASNYHVQTKDSSPSHKKVPPKPLFRSETQGKRPGRPHVRSPFPSPSPGLRIPMF